MAAGVKGSDTGGGRIKIYSKGSNVVLLVSGKSTAQALVLPRCTEANVSEELQKEKIWLKSTIQNAER